MLAFETIHPKTAATAAVIWLHGLGADGHDFIPIVPELNIDDLAIRFIFPHAPVRPVTLNRGMHMPAWFDIHEISPAAKQDEAGIQKAGEEINALIELQHQQHIPYDRILLVGFSQGGALALYTALTSPHQLAGAIGLSTYLPPIPAIKNALTTKDPFPIFLAHGTQDPIVPLEAGEMTHELLTSQNFPVTWHTYKMAHQVCAQEIKEMATWLRHILLK
jgi:phospholipase/carboxylesterase